MRDVPTKFVPLLEWFGNTVFLDGHHIIATNGGGTKMGAILRVGDIQHSKCVINNVTYIDNGDGTSKLVGDFDHDHCPTDWFSIVERKRYKQKYTKKPAYEHVEVDWDEKQRKMLVRHTTATIHFRAAIYSHFSMNVVLPPLSLFKAIYGPDYHVAVGERY